MTINSVHSIFTNPYAANEQKDVEQPQTNIVQAAEAAPEVSIQSLTDKLAAAQTQFQALDPALNNNALTQPLVKNIAEYLAKIQTGIAILQDLNARTNHIAQKQCEIEGCIKLQSQTIQVTKEIIAQIHDQIHVINNMMNQLTAFQQICISGTVWA